MQHSVAVIIAVRNGLPFLAEAIKCVEAQTYSPLELVIVDDGSTDGSLETARQAGCRILQTPGVGPAAARNAGIRSTVSDAIAFLDADDLWPPWTLHKLATALWADPEVGFSQGLIQNFRAVNDGSKRFFTAPYRFVNLGASLYRRSLFDTVGLLDESLQFSEDLDFMMRCWENDISKALVNEVALYYRRHAHSMTAGTECEGPRTVQIVKRRLNRLHLGLYDPKKSRRLPATEYVGIGPKHQDDITADEPSSPPRRRFRLIRNEYATWISYRNESFQCSYIQFLAARWSAPAWKVPFIGARRAFQKIASATAVRSYSTAFHRRGSLLRLAAKLGAQLLS